MYILLVFFILVVLFIVIVLNLNVKLFVKIKSNTLISYVKFYLFNIPISKINTEKLTRRSKKKNKTRGRAYSEYLTIKDILRRDFIKLERFKLESEISAADPILTAFVVMLISSIISIFMKYYNVKPNHDTYKYTINPVYTDTIVLNIHLDSIIKINLVHIIYIFYKKWRRDINGRKASNRKSYGNCYEQHKGND